MPDLKAQFPQCEFGRFDCAHAHPEDFVPAACLSCVKGSRFIRKDEGKVSDGSSATYYTLPPMAAELQDLISYRNMNAQIGEIFRACYRMGKVSHSPPIRDVKKIIFYAEAELRRLQALEKGEK